MPSHPITGAAFSPQLGAASYLLQHYNSPGGHFRPIKPASRDSTFSLPLMPQTRHSVISTLVTNALLLSLISLVDSTIGGPDKEGIGKKHPVAFPASSSLPPPGLVNFPLFGLRWRQGSGKNNYRWTGKVPSDYCGRPCFSLLYESQQQQQL